jgi:hypothetical protein
MKCPDLVEYVMAGLEETPAGPRLARATCDVLTQLLNDVSGRALGERLLILLSIADAAHREGAVALAEEITEIGNAHRARLAPSSAINSAGRSFTGAPRARGSGATSRKSVGGRSPLSLRTDPKPPMLGRLVGCL